MSSLLQHSSIIADHQSEYLEDAMNEIKVSMGSVVKDNSFRSIFKTSMATYTVLTGIAKAELRLITAAAGCARRTPLLIACRQLSLAYVELRRFVELVLWFPYFDEHPVEWEEFCRNPDAGYSRSLDTPIAYGAHRERDLPAENLATAI